jgi:hypothetical protein
VVTYHPKNLAVHHVPFVRKLFARWSRWFHQEDTENSDDQWLWLIRFWVKSPHFQLKSRQWIVLWDSHPLEPRASPVANKLCDKVTGYQIALASFSLAYALIFLPLVTLLPNE